MKLKLDLHLHTTNSSDAHTPVGELDFLCKKAGVDGIAVTDHNKLSSIEKITQSVAIPGVEISSRDGHIIALGLQTLIPRDLSADVTVRMIHDEGGVCIIPHPYDLFRSSVRPRRLTERPDAIEVINSASLFHTLTWDRARRFALEKKIPTTGGSDSHIPETVGRAFTIVETNSSSVLAVLQSIREGLIIPAGGSVRFRERLRKIFL